MVNRWAGRPEPKPGQGTLYWHVLFRDQPQLQALAAFAQEKLRTFSGLHLTPKQWLHLTIMAVGSTELFTPSSMEAMIERARHLLSKVPPATITFSRVLYHSEAIMLRAMPIGALDPVSKAIRDASHSTTAEGEVREDDSWIPHVTLAYSTALQPVAPIVGALGYELPMCEVTIRSLDLIIQEGPERLWQWRSLAELPLGSS